MSNASQSDLYEIEAAKTLPRSPDQEPRHQEAFAKMMVADHHGDLKAALGPLATAAGQTPADESSTSAARASSTT